MIEKMQASASAEYDAVFLFEQPLLPAPDAVQFRDYVYTSTVYPLDDDGMLPGAGKPVSPFLGESAIVVQAHRALDRLERVLEAAGSRLANVLRCDVMLADEQDFYEFNNVWKERFPTLPPARATIGVGDEHLVPGVVIGLQAVALRDGSTLQREIITAPDALDTLANEGAAQAVKAGDYVFPSAVPAIESYTVGIPPSNPLRAEPEVQTEAVMENLAKVLAQAGTSLENSIKSQNLMADLADWFHINPAWGRYMMLPPPPRTSVSMRSLIVPRARVIANLTVLVPSPENRKEAIRTGVRFHVSEYNINFSPAVATRDFISLAGHVAYDYGNYTFLGSDARMGHLASDIEAQTDGIMADRAEILEANGARIDDVFEAKVYLKYPRRDYRGFERAWQRWFPDPERRPALQIIPTLDIHLEGTIIEIELLAARPG